MNPYYRQNLIDELTIIFRDVHDEIKANPYGVVDGDVLRQVATFGAGLLQDWGVNRDVQHVIISEALANAGLTSE